MTSHDLTSGAVVLPKSSGVYTAMALSLYHYLYIVLLCLCFVVKFASGVTVSQDLSLTLPQKNALDQFRQKVEPLLYRDHMKNDIYLIRWLRARDFDIRSAESMLRAHLNWRKSQKIDGIQSEDWSDMRHDFHATIDTYDREERPIGVIDIFDWDIRGCILQGKGPRLLRYMDYLLENITMQVFERQNRGMNVTQWLVLANTDGFNVVHHACAICLPLWIQFIQDIESNHAGWMDEIIVINAPATINIVLDAIRPFLSSYTRQALKVFSPNKNKWMPYIDKRIDKKERRPQYGGTKPFLRD